MASPKITVIGAGSFGNHAANLLTKTYPEYQVTLLADRDFAYNLPATHRLVVGGFSSKDITRPLSEIIAPKVNLIQIKEVIDFDTKECKIITKAGQQETVPHDVLILATGSKWGNPIATQNFGASVDSMAKYIESEAAKLNAAKKVVIGGLGFVGLELAGELGYKFKDQLSSGEKEVICIHSSPENVLDSSYLDSLRNSSRNYLQNMNIKLIFNEKADYDEKADSTIVKLSDSTIENVDLYYNCTGPIANLPATTLSGLETNGRGFVKVQKTLQTLNYPNIFAIGDINDAPGKRIIYRDDHAQVLKQNVQSVISGNTSQLKEFVVKPLAVAASIGPEVGVGQAPIPFFGAVKIPEFLIVRMKSTHLFNEKIEDIVGKVA
ncbi:hypothetical protein DASC09_004020 [Saccharomycopsis crataegensis]|uniref:FAD/NAD(P)-binding domain-containing protein n=1 Tax=Saccharomycopsis crataegensis TaxID=43959 RepID=A0AAV5QEN3_9ASCO|nr:hypothetical protein DASC09_004020 [Saccharomycopsis crataegensis]